MGNGILERDYAGLTRLITAASKAGVKKLVVGDVVVDFEAVTLTTGISDVYDRVDVQAVEAAMRDPENLLITDPLEFERIQMDGEA